jgi:gamma-glutamylputrescine oxidase
MTDRGDAGVNVAVATDTGPVWSALSLPEAPPFETSVRGADVIVVGLGASGLAAALEARARGAQVLAVDAAGFAAGAAGRNGGLLMVGGARFHHDAIATWGADRARRILDLTAAERDRQVAAMPGIVRRTGSVRVAASPEEADDVRAQHAAMVADGVAATLDDGPTVGVRVPDDAACNPAARVRAMAAEAHAAGVRFAVTGPIAPIAAGRLATASGPLEADTVLVCVDGGLEDLVPDLVGRVRTTRLQMLAFAPGFGACPTPLYARWGYEYAQMLPDGRIVAGGMRDRFEGAEWDAPAVPSADVQRALEAWARGAFATDAVVTHRWAGRVSYTASKLPVCGRVGDVWVAGAHSGMGNLIGVLAGRAVAAAALAGDDAVMTALAGPETTG